MVGIWKNENGLHFTGIVAETEEKAWAYLDGIVGEKGKFLCPDGWYYPKASRTVFEIKRVTVI